MGSGILDKYELGGIVGEGSYGTVHRARNRYGNITPDRTTFDVELGTNHYFEKEGFLSVLLFNRT